MKEAVVYKADIGADPLILDKGVNTVYAFSIPVYRLFLVSFYRYHQIIKGKKVDAKCNKFLSIEELIKILDASVVLDRGWLKDGISCVYASDLMSDILSHSRPNSLLLTGLINSQTVRTAEMVEIVAVCFIHGKLPHAETIELAQQNELPLLTTRLSMFEACGKLYNAGIIS